MDFAASLLKELKPGDRHFENVTRISEATDRINRIVRDITAKRKHGIKTYPGEVQVMDLSQASHHVPAPPAAAPAPVPIPAAARPAMPTRPAAPPVPQAARPVAASTPGPARMEI